MAAGSKHIWTEEMIRFLKENYERLSNKELAAELGVGLTSTRTKLYEMGYKRMEMEYWTEEMVDFLKQNYKDIGDVEMAEIFSQKYPKEKGWTNKHIEKKRKYLKLKRTRNEINAIKKRNIDAGRYIIGSKKTWKTRGVTPTGTIKLWKDQNGQAYKVIKTKDGFVHYKRWLWEKINGPVPEDMLVATKNMDSLDTRIENLELISREQHGSRVHIRTYPPELRKSILITRKIKKELQN